MRFIISVIDVIYVGGYVFLLRKLLELTNTQITRFSSKYLLLVAAISIYWLLGSNVVIGFTIVNFLPKLRSVFIIFSGILGIITGIIILENCIK